MNMGRSTKIIPSNALFLSDNLNCIGIFMLVTIIEKFVAYCK